MKAKHWHALGVPDPVVPHRARIYGEVHHEHAEPNGPGHSHRDPNDPDRLTSTRVDFDPTDPRRVRMVHNGRPMRIEAAHGMVEGTARVDELDPKRNQPS